MKDKIKDITNYFSKLTTKQKLGLMSIILIFLGLIITVNLTLHRQNLKSKASVDISRNFSITEASSSSQVNCQDSNCTTNSSTVHIKFDPNNAQELLNELP